MIIGVQLCLQLMAYRRAPVSAPTPGAFESHAQAALWHVHFHLNAHVDRACVGMTTIAGKALSAYLWMGHRLLKGLLSPIFLALAWCDVWKGMLLRLLVYNIICLLVCLRVQVQSVCSTGAT